MLPDIPFWWILGGAAALAAWWVTRVFGANLDTKIFVHIVQRCVRDKNVVRALKICTATSPAPVAMATRQALLASVSREEDAQRPAGYRGNRPVPLDAVKARIRARYDNVFHTAAAPLKNTFYLALPSPLLLGGTAYLAFFRPEQDWRIIGAAGVGLLFWLYVAWSYNKILASRDAAFESLWPSFEAVYHDRNTIDIHAKPADPAPEPPPPPPATPDAKNPRITLDILEPGKPLRTLSFDQPIIKIGKLATSHVQLEADGVARMHAVVEASDGKVHIIDLGATRTTRVNLESVNKRELANGDVIGIGDAELVVRLGVAGDQSS